jgi:hypothetical protein
VVVTTVRAPLGIAGSRMTAWSCSISPVKCAMGTAALLRLEGHWFPSFVGFRPYEWLNFLSPLQVTVGPVPEMESDLKTTSGAGCSKGIVTQSVPDCEPRDIQSTWRPT